MHFHDLLNKVSREIKNSKNRVLWIFSLERKKWSEEEKRWSEINSKENDLDCCFRKDFCLFRLILKEISQL